MADNSKNKEKLSWNEMMHRTVRSWKTLWKKQPCLFLAAGLSSLSSALGPYVTIYLSALIIGELSGSRDPNLLTWLILAQLVSSAAILLLGSMLSRWYKAEETCFMQTGANIYTKKAFSMDFPAIDRQHTYDLYSQIEQNQRWNNYGFYRSVYDFKCLIEAVLRILGGVCLSVTLFLSRVPQGSSLSLLNSPLSAILCVIILITVAVIAPLVGNHAQNYWVKYSDMAKFGNRCFRYSLQISDDRARSADMRMYDQYENLVHDIVNKPGMQAYGMESQIARWAKGPMGLLTALSKGISAILTGLIYLFVCLKAWAGAFGIGSVTQYVGAITNLFHGISDLLTVVGDIRANAAFLGTTFEYMDIPNEMYQGSLTTEKRSDRKYDVEFRDVSFRYPGSETWALRHVSMKFRVGSRLAVVGKNGSGKTTFIKLLCRLYDPTEGEILLNGIDIRKYRYDDYIHIFSVVFQDFQLFSLPLGQNVACAEEYDRERVTDCLQKAGFSERLSQMEKGLDTYLYKELDKEGVEISGGEAQKIAIARALYKDSPFLILDEPTAALDPIAEAEIYGKFNEIATDKTTVYISHRLSSCKFCDEIAVFDAGAVVQKGSHTELLADTEGKYYELWHAQAQYYTEEAVRVLLG